MPHNLYHLRKVLQVESSTAVTYHCCENDHYIWPNVDKRDWSKHFDDVCPIRDCRKPRFRKQAGRNGAGSSYIPTKIMQYFDLARCIKHLHSLPQWNKARDQVCRDVNTPDCATVFGTQLSKLMNHRLKQCLKHSNIGLYEIGTDWFSFFSDKRRKCTTGVFFIRAIDLPDGFKQKRIFHLPLMISPGPKEPRSIDTYVDFIVKDFERWQPGGPGIEVERVQMIKDRAEVAIHRETMRHWPVLASWIVDNPARQKVASMRGQSALHACGYCWMHGVYMAGRTVFPGYHAPMVVPATNIPTRELHAPIQAHTGNDAVQKTCDEMILSGRKVRDHEWDPHLGGCNGLSPVARIPYVGYKDVWAIGIAHILLLGVIPDFFNTIFMKGRDLPQYVISQSKREIIRRREAIIRMPTGMPRALSIIDDRGNFEMSHYWVHIK